MRLKGGANRVGEAQAGPPADAATVVRPGATAAAVPPNWPMLLLVTMMPLQIVYLVHIPHLGNGPNFLNIMTVLSVLAWKLNRQRAVPTRTPLHGPIYGYAAILILSCFYGFSTLGYVDEEHLHKLKDILIPVLLYFVVVNSVRDRRGIVWTLVATLIPLPYMFRTFHHQLARVYSWHYDNDLRQVHGTFLNIGSNEFAAFFCGYTLVLLALIYYLKGTAARVVLGMLVSLNLYCLLFSYSRGAWLGFLFGLGVTLWLLNRKLALALALAVLMTWGALLSFLPVSVQERFSTIRGEQQIEDDNSAMTRLELWGMAFEQFRKHPVLGIGYHTFHHVNPLAKDTHNYFMLILAEQGIVGFTFLVLILWRGFASGRRLYRVTDDPLLKALGIGFAGCTAALVMANMFGDRFSHYPLITYFWVYLALVQRGLLLTGGQVARLGAVPHEVVPEHGRAAGTTS